MWVKAEMFFDKPYAILSLPCRDQHPFGDGSDSLLDLMHKGDHDEVERVVLGIIAFMRPDLAGGVLTAVCLHLETWCWHFGYCHPALPRTKPGDTVQTFTLERSTPTPQGYQPPAWHDKINGPGTQEQFEKWAAATDGLRAEAEAAMNKVVADGYAVPERKSVAGEYTLTSKGPIVFADDKARDEYAKIIGDMTDAMAEQFPDLKADEPIIAASPDLAAIPEPTLAEERDRRAEKLPT